MSATETRHWTYKLPALGIDIRMRLDADPDASTETRRQIARDLRELTRAAATETSLPRAERTARFVRTISGQGLVVRKGRSNSVYMTTLTRKRQLKSAVGWIEFGGTVETPILPVAVGANAKSAPILERRRRRSKTNPKHAGALKLPNGNARRLVMTARKFKGKHLIGKAINRSKPDFENHLKADLVRYFEAQGFETD